MKITYEPLYNLILHLKWTTLALDPSWPMLLPLAAKPERQDFLVPYHFASVYSCTHWHYNLSSHLNVHGTIPNYSVVRSTHTSARNLQ